MNKMLLVIIIILAIIAFFYPKEKFFGCGAVCLEGEMGKVTEEAKNTICIGFEEKIPVNDATGKRCYGIFIRK